MKELILSLFTCSLIIACSIIGSSQLSERDKAVSIIVIGITCFTKTIRQKARDFSYGMNAFILL